MDMLTSIGDLAPEVYEQLVFVMGGDPQSMPFTDLDYFSAKTLSPIVRDLMPADSQGSVPRHASPLEKSTQSG